MATPYFIFLRLPPVGSARSVGCALTDHGSSYLPGRADHQACCNRGEIATAGYCAPDEAGQVRLEQRVRTTAKALREVFGGMPRSRIALEIGTHSAWIIRLLGELGHEVMLANAQGAADRGEPQERRSADAQTLARLARIDPELLYPVKHRSAQAQADLTLIRGRAGLVRARTSLVNTARSLAKSYWLTKSPTQEALPRLSGMGVSSTSEVALLANHQKQSWGIGSSNA